MKAIGSHRPLADELILARCRNCPTCKGLSVLDIDVGRGWKDCPDCRGSGSIFTGSLQKYMEIRVRILREFPDAVPGAFDPASIVFSENGGPPSAGTNRLAVPGKDDDHGGSDPMSSALLPEAEIKCVFHTLAVRNEALKKKWRAGLYDYWETYGAVHNAQLTVTCIMEPYWDEHFDALVKSGLKQGVDFILFDAGDVSTKKELKPVHFRADWLGGYVHDAGVMIYLKH